jgi:hypothetical protein
MAVGSTPLVFLPLAGIPMVYDVQDVMFAESFGARRTSLLHNLDNHISKLFRFHVKQCLCIREKLGQIRHNID